MRRIATRAFATIALGAAVACGIGMGAAAAGAQSATSSAHHHQTVQHRHTTASPQYQANDWWM